MSLFRTEVKTDLCPGKSLAPQGLIEGRRYKPEARGVFLIFADSKNERAMLPGNSILSV